MHKTNMKKYIVALVALVMTNIAVAQHDANFNKIKRTYTVNDDGTVEYNYRKELKLISLRSFFSVYGETFIVYNPDFQSLRINESYTVRKDGSRVTTPNNAFVEQLPSTCTNCERYSRMKEMVVVHTALEYGATIVLDYTITSNTNNLSETITLAESAPVTDYEVIVKLAGGQKLYHELKNSELKPIITNNTYKWQFKNLPQTSGEYYLPAAEDLYPTLCFTTKNHTSNDLTVEVSELKNADKLLLELTVAGDKMKTAMAIQDYVVKYVNHNHVPMTLNNNNVSSSEVTFASSCGNNVEKAVLLRDLLRKAGYLAELNVPIIPHKCGREEFGMIAENSISVKANIEGKEYDLYMDGTKKLHGQKPSPRVVDVVVRDMKWDSKANEISAKSNKYIINGVEQNGTKVKFDIKEIQKGCYTVDITAVKGGMNVLPMYLTGKRTQPLYCGKTNESYDYTIVMPSGMHYVGKNMMLSYEKPFGSIQIQIEQKGNVLEIKRKLKITKDMIKPADYEAFRAMMVDWNNSNYTNLMFKKN